jgi:hypothetical protein
MQVSGAAAKQAAVASNYFSNMCLAGEQSPFLKDIDQVGDNKAAAARLAHRTFTLHTSRAGAVYVCRCRADPSAT